MKKVFALIGRRKGKVMFTTLYSNREKAEIKKKPLKVLIKRIKKPNGLMKSKKKKCGTNVPLYFCGRSVNRTFVPVSYRSAPKFSRFKALKYFFRKLGSQKFLNFFPKKY
jgi:hypothetical protein